MSIEAQLIKIESKPQTSRESFGPNSLEYRYSLALQQRSCGSVVSEDIDVDDYSMNTAVKEGDRIRHRCLRIGLLLALLLACILAFGLISYNGKQKKAVNHSFSGASVEPLVAPTAAPSGPLELTPEFMILEPQVTDPTKLLDPETPQGKAFQRILLEEIVQDRDFRVTQRYAMMVIYYSMGGENWAWQTGWSDFSAEECEWYGVSICRFSEGRRIAAGLQIPSNNAVGWVPEEICMLDNLETLLLENNYLIGDLPACMTSLSKVFQFDVHNNQFSGLPPSGFLNMPKLETLDLSSNTFSGGLDFLGGTDNNFEGAQLSKIATLRLHNNGFVGDIPAELFELSSLAELTLQDTLLTGDVSAMCDKQTVTVLIIDCSKVVCSEQCCSCA